MSTGPRLISLYLIMLVQIGVWKSSSASAQGLPTTKEALQSRGIATTKRSLVAALRSKDAEVRGLAAEQLAEDDMQNAKPALLEALRAETDPRVRVKIAFFLAEAGEPIGLATLTSVANSQSADGISKLLAGYALGRLGNSAGDKQLTDICTSNAASPSLRIKATVYAHSLHRDYCDAAVPEVLQISHDKDTVTQALNLLPNLKTVESDRQKFVSLAAHELTDPSIPIRLTAATTLARLGSSSGIPPLQEAASKEENVGCRTVMERALDQLRRATHP